MSMLAERRRKQKWSLNPRGKYWSEDQNKFGQKMLEKMGWSVGKGLGANEDGITEHVKVSYKNDSKGMGFKETDNQWTEHESNFSQLLSSLSDNKEIQTNTEEILTRVESLEKKSQNSRARVHYHKFTRGKDLSRYSEKDLANIFGKKSLKKENQKMEKNEEIVESEDISNKKFGVETHNGGSMLDYFKKKLPSYKKYTVNEVNNLEKENNNNNNNSESDCERPSFGFGFKSNKIKPDFVSYINEQVNCELNNDCESSKKRKPEEILESAFTPLQKKFKKFENLNSLNDEEKIVHTPDKKFKKNDKKKKEKSKEQNGLDNPAFDDKINEVKTKKQSLDIIVEEEEEEEKSSKIVVEDDEGVKSSKKKKKKKENVNEDIENVKNDLDCEIKLKTEKKKRKKRSDEEIEVTNDESKIKKRKREETSAIVNPCFDPNDSVESTEISHNSFEVKRKKKKKSEKGIENPALNLSESFIEEEKIEEENIKKNGKKSKEGLNLTVDNEISLGKRKKEKKFKEGIDNPMLNITDTSTVQENDETPAEKRKKKKKSKEGIDNPTLNITDTSVQELEMPIMDEEVVLNTVAVITPVLKRKKETDGKTLRRRKSVRFSDVDQKIFMNGADSPADLRKNSHETGIDNEAFDKFGNQIEENIDSLSKQLDNYQAEVENDLNEAKMEIMVGEMGDPNGENEILPNGDAKLKFKYANFGRIPPWLRKNDSETRAKRSYRHLIKGDIVLGFKNSNLHEIEGYGNRRENGGG